MTLEEKAREMRNALDGIELALMGFEDSLLEVGELFATTGDGVVMQLRIKAANFRQLTTALEECSRIVNSPEFIPAALIA